MEKKGVETGHVLGIAKDKGVLGTSLITQKSKEVKVGGASGGSPVHWARSINPPLALL